MSLATNLRRVGGGSASFTPLVTTLVGLYNGENGPAAYSIGAATYNGTWTRDSGNPVIAAGSSGAWDDDHVKDPWLIHDGSQFVVYYAGHDGTKYQVGRATASSVSGPWTKAGGNPLVTVGSGGAFDDAGVIFPVVLHEPTDTGREWKLWYGANDGTTIRVGYAYSSDGLSWTKHGQVINVGAGGTWSDEGVAPGAVYNDGGTYHLYVAGRQGPTNPRWQGGLYTFTDPEGSYTAASNPVMLARFNDANTSQTLTANTASGSAVVTVTSTAAWNVNEPMALADGDSETHVASILSIDSGTQVTLTAPAPSTFATANGAVLRPLAWNALWPRTVRPATGGGYEAFVTVFQPVEDLSVGGTTLREGSMRMTATDLDGPWSFDYSTGLIFPLTPPSTTWDAISAENLSVIAAP
jgi:hypothetical protein